MYFTCFCIDLFLSKMPAKYKLTYFDITALAEPIRFMFAYGGIEYEDVRVPRDQWPAIKPSKYYLLHFFPSAT